MTIKILKQELGCYYIMRWRNTRPGDTPPAHSGCRGVPTRLVTARGRNDGSVVTPISKKFRRDTFSAGETGHGVRATALERGGYALQPRARARRARWATPTPSPREEPRRVWTTFGTAYFPRGKTPIADGNVPNARSCRRSVVALSRRGRAGPLFSTAATSVPSWSVHGPAQGSSLSTLVAPV